MPCISMRVSARAVLLLSAASAGLSAQAADQALTAALLKLGPSGAAVGELVKDVTQDMPIGTPAAAVVLGVAATEVPRVTSFRKVGLTLSNGLDRNGKLAQSVGAEIVPAMALQDLKWDSLRSPLMRAWARTSVSFAALPDEKSGSARTALGVQTVLYSREADQAIALATSSACTQVARNYVTSAPGAPVLDASGQPIPGRTHPEFTDADQQLLSACMAMIQRSLNRWNPTTLALGVGQAYYTADASVRKLRSSANSWWLTGAWGMDFSGVDVDPAQRLGIGVTAHWRRSSDERVADPGGGADLLAESARLTALNLRVGTPKAAFLGEHSRRVSALTGLPDETRRRSILGAEFRISEGLYIAFGLASDQGGRDGTSKKAALANLKWGFSDKSILSP